MEKTTYFKALYEIARELNHKIEPDRVLSVITENVTTAMAAKACSVLLLTLDKKELIHRAWYGLSDQYVKKGPLATDVALSAVLRGQTQAILDITRDIRIHYRDEAVREGIASILSVPIQREGNVVGVLRVYSGTVREFSAEEVDFLSAVANLGAVTLYRAQSRERLELAVTDCLAEIERLRAELDVVKKRCP